LGEIIAYNAEGRTLINVLQNHMSEGPALHFYAFDLLTLQGKDPTQEPLRSTAQDFAIQKNRRI